MTGEAKQKTATQVTRRQLTKELAGAALVLAAGVTMVQQAAGGAARAQENKVREKLGVPAKLPDQVPQDRSVLRMQRDLLRALQKSLVERRWIMVIDLRKCAGCSTCTVACKAENKLPPGVVYRPVLEEEIGVYPHLARRFLPRTCMHCENPPCTKVCPVGATYRRSDGIVSIDYDKCIGCRYCVTACPYGARTFDWGEFYTEGTPQVEKYEMEPSFEYGQPRRRVKGQSPIGNTRKCHFCLHRLNNGMLPACVTTCISRATYFGDANDRQSLVSELIGSSRVMRLKEELGTKPNVYYLI